jgi:2-methylfumaryl-CoA isomerase
MMESNEAKTPGVEGDLSTPGQRSATELPPESPVGILSGLRVVEGAAFIAGPIAGMTLAQLGADVIRFDPIGGGLDYQRWPLTSNGRSLYWAGLNKGKRSIAVDVRSPEGRELVVALITTAGDGAGIFLTNLHYSWLQYEELRERRNDLVMLQLLGDSQGRTAFDYTVNAAVGYPVATGSVESEVPTNHVLPAWDLLAGMHATLGVLAAERHRRLTGQGQLIRVALTDVALATVGHLGHVGEAQINGTQRERYGNYVYGSFGCDFETADHGRVMVAAMTPKQWDSLCEATATKAVLEALSEDLGVDLSDDAGRFKARQPIAEAMRPWFRARTAKQIGEQLDRRGVPWDRYQTFLELVSSDPRCSINNPMFAAVEQPGIGTFLVPGSPLDFSAIPRCRPAPSPLLGQQTDEILSELLALSDSEIGRLHDSGVIGGDANS